MRNTKLLAFMLVMVCMAGAPGIISAKDAAGGFVLIHVKGQVHRTEVGGEGLNVVSLWDNRPVSWVAEDGSFTTVISNQRPQKISLVDNKKQTRGLVISLPRYDGTMLIDAHSTAIAVLFHESGSFGQSQEVENFCRLLAHKKSFQDLVAFLKNKLPLASLEELTRDEEYACLLDKCNSEIFGEDPKAIHSSLQSAQRELEKVLQ
jgi:hypothetical protein